MAVTTPRDRASAGTNRTTLVLTAVAVAIAAGAVVGLLARLLMRLVALTVLLKPSFSFSGTAGIVFIFVVVALPAAVASAVGARRWIRRISVIAGTLALGYFGVVIGAQELASADSIGAGRWAMLLGLCALLAVLVFGHVPATTRLVRRLRSRSVTGAPLAR